MDDTRDLIGTGEAAKILGVHPNTVRRWADDGDIPYRRTPRGQRRFDRATVLALLAIPQPEAVA